MRGESGERFEADGVVTLSRYLDGPTTAALIEGLDEPIASPGRTTAAVLATRGVVFARRNLLTLPAVRRFIASDGVRDLLERFSPGVAPVRGLLFDKTGDANWTVPWHQDRSIAVASRHDVPGFGPWSTKAGIVHVQPPAGVLKSMLTLRFSLDSCGPDNGPLRAIRGTHHALLTRSEIDTAVATAEQTICTTDAGGVVIMRPLLLHASSSARHVTRRRVLHLEFGPTTLPVPLQWAIA